MSLAEGSFEVRVTPQDGDGTPVGRMSIEKTFAGDLIGTSVGSTLAHTSDVPGSAGYVAMELVTGTIDARTGTFVLQHTATMTRGEPDLTIIVTPGSGTEELVGLRGSMTIEIVDGDHRYTFDYGFEP